MDQLAIFLGRTAAGMLDPAVIVPTILICIAIPAKFKFALIPILAGFLGLYAVNSGFSHDLKNVLLSGFSAAVVYTLIIISIRKISLVRKK